MATITTERLRLRPAKLADVTQLHEIFCDPNAMRYWSSLPHSDISQTAEFVEGMIGLSFKEGEEFVVDFDGRIIGKAGFWNLPEVGFIFHPAFWGKGLASEAISALVNYGFQARNLPKIVADVDPRNAASIRLLEKLGFHETHRDSATILIGEEWCDSVYFSLNAPAG